jgi:hypothetical protein
MVTSSLSIGKITAFPHGTGTTSSPVLWIGGRVRLRAA